MIEFYEGDCRDKLLAMIRGGRQVHAVVTDPPYGLTSITKRFGKAESAPATGKDGSFGRLSRNWRGSQWDNTGIERDLDFWALLRQVMLPGAYVFAFSGSRTYHRQAVAMEDAGFTIMPLHSWIYGNGFPKPHSAEKSVAKLAPEQAADWAGWYYGGAALKPAMEPIIFAQNPFGQASGGEKKIATTRPFEKVSGGRNIVTHGVGALNIDGCLGPDERWPANVLHDGTTEVFPELDYFPAFYHRKADEVDRAGSDHPSVKPVGLIRHLVKLICPLGGTVLDPFAGTGTTGEAARLEGMNAVLMEAEPGYAETIRQRFGLRDQDLEYLLS